jgi:hypothetical protein
MVLQHPACGTQRRILLKSKADRILANDRVSRMLLSFRKKANWLRSAAKEMAEVMEHEWRTFRKS